jgi:hypothetical protein
MQVAKSIWEYCLGKVGISLPFPVFILQLPNRTGFTIPCITQPLRIPPLTPCQNELKSDFAPGIPMPDISNGAVSDQDLHSG